MKRIVLSAFVFLIVQNCFARSFSVGVGRDKIKFYELNEKIISNEKVYSLIEKSDNKVDQYRIITRQLFEEIHQDFDRLFPQKKWLQGEFKFLCESQVYLKTSQSQGTFCLDGKKQLSVDFAAFFKKLDKISSL